MTLIQSFTIDLKKKLKNEFFRLPGYPVTHRHQCGVFSYWFFQPATGKQNHHVALLCKKGKAVLQDDHVWFFTCRLDAFVLQHVHALFFWKKY